ncbi:MAG: RNase H1/viroplasmin domain-containing protein [Candidatus Peribacteria bacterium]|nr:MAG: RNase H1/viroplasmin domain-containing protein [Candidatus Peribacteria bacterium]
MAKPKRYVVRKGKKTGIFTTWDECKAAVHGYAGAQYKSYETRAAAEQAFASSYSSQITQKTKDHRLATKDYTKIIEPLSIAVDAACSSNPGVLERQ